ncbi:leucine-rich repeat-containing G-protein coupled receptor 4 isoform X2 [Leguminivora glycinivorella]|uniref:leucine-rich repeat-containing G-protein coupled receptor 4 isoform X2 n=1 Tax=Leguminivora glycinivorella TaxID=1035111 RepID=UPI00200FF15F|nr:leucine-rich repeat-containing G-protein coupled receptor 4 isoform X2 [Leguminivora glycinivorella]
MVAQKHVLAATLLCALAGQLGAGASLHCAMRREISPCTCRREDSNTGAILVLCHRIQAYEEIAKALTNKFSPETKIGLDISHSQLPDIADHSFRELGLSITKLKLNNDNLSELPETAFTRLDLVDYFSVSDNELAEIPRHVARHLPHAKTLDLCRNKISKLTEDDFKDLQELEHLLIANNEISKIERHALPKALKHIHLGINSLNSLNGALRDLDELEWIFINANNLKSLENELPTLAEDEFAEAEVLAYLDISYNQIKSLNGSLRSLKSLRYLNLTYNALTEFSLQEIKGLKKLDVIDFSHNKINHITGNMENLVDVETKVLELRLDHNHLVTLGGALIGFHGLMRLNLSNNQLQQVSSDDLNGLEDLKVLDLSFNDIATLEETSKSFLPSLEELIAHHNNISALDKDFHGLPSLCMADLSYNKIRSINYDLVSKTRCTINGVPSKLKIYLQDNPVLCDERMNEMVMMLENLNARVSGSSTCLGTQTAAPVLSMRALSDGAPRQDAAVIVVAHLLPHDDQRPLPLPLPPAFRRVGAIIGHVLPEGGLPVVVDPPVTLPPTTNVVVKWPDDQHPHPHPLADLRLRDLNAPAQ